MKKDDSIHITKADKTAALVIMDKEDYNRKMTTILSDDTTYERIRGDPTEKLNSIKEIFGKHSYVGPAVMEIIYFLSRIVEFWDIAA